MKSASLISGGKDSLYATYLASKEHEIKVLISIKSSNPESYMFHVPNIDLVKLQAESMGFPLIFRHTKGVKEEELQDLEDALSEAKERCGIEGVVSGAIFSVYQKKRIDDICDRLALSSRTPLWGRKPRVLWDGMFEAGFEVVISAVAADGLTEEWLGKVVDRQAFNKLLNLHQTCYVCTGGEGGEFETLVVDCPLFKKRIVIEGSRTQWDEKTQSGQFIVERARLVRK